MPRVAYFAYGSNMHSATLRGRRGIEWTRAAAARASGWRLVVDKPSLLGTGEAMASIVPEEGAECWGVLYEIEESDLEHLELTEGVKIGHYERVSLLVEAGDAWGEATRIEAFSLASSKRDASTRPSTRYMKILLAGAAEHGLPAEWLELLAAIEAVEEKAESLALRPWVDRAMKKQV